MFIISFQMYPHKKKNKVKACKDCDMEIPCKITGPPNGKDEYATYNGNLVVSRLPNGVYKQNGPSKS